MAQQQRELYVKAIHFSALRNEWLRNTPTAYNKQKTESVKVQHFFYGRHKPPSLLN